MNFIKILIISFSLATDAFAVATSHGMSSKSNTLKTAHTYGLFFGTFQGAMALLGYAIHLIIPRQLLEYSALIAFALLTFVGIQMIHEGLTHNLDEHSGEKVKIPQLIALSFATSVDALLTGTTLGFFGINIIISAATIAVVAGAMSFVGYLVGKSIGLRVSKLGALGGTAIICIAIYTLVSSL